MKNAHSCRVLLFGGLGNQLFQIAAAKHVANSKKIILDTSFVMNDSNPNWFKEHTKFDLTQQIKLENSRKLNWLSRRVIGYAIRNSTQLIQKNLKYIPILLLRKFTSKIISLFVFKNCEVLIANGLGYDEKLKQKKRDVLMIGYFQSYKWMESDSEIIPLIRKLIGCEFVKEKEVDLALLQIRLGDFLNSDDFLPINIDYISKAIDLIQLKQEIRKIEVFSDDTAGARKILSGVSEHKLYFSDSKSESALTSIRAMTAFQNHIISSSTFGFWGAILAKQTSNVVAPIPWFRDAIDPKDLIPPGWSRISR